MVDKLHFENCISLKWYVMLSYSFGVKDNHDYLSLSPNLKTLTKVKGLLNPFDTGGI